MIQASLISCELKGIEEGLHRMREANGFKVELKHSIKTGFEGELPCGFQHAYIDKYNRVRSFRAH